MTPENPLGWKAALIPVVAIVFLAMLPQMGLWGTGGSGWNGSYFVSNYDETAYSAYVNALIQGAPRKNDPFLGRADEDQPETLYSIQFIPAYAIALPARLLGLSVSTAFILLAVLIAAFSALAIRQLLIEVTGDELAAAVGPIAILCLGTAAAFQGELRHLVEGRVLTDFLPFLRRYQPGLAFPLFFVFCLFVHMAVTSGASGRLIKWALAAGVVFAVLVFSYFYLWTAAAAWVACYIAAAGFFDRENAKNAVVSGGIIALFALAALVPYFYLLSLRPAELDSVQLLTLTRVPEFLSPSMLLGVIVAGVAYFTLRPGSRQLPVIFAFGLSPVILFNQQVITGRSLQPVHYELFIANYSALTAAMLLLSAWRKGDEAASPAGQGVRFQRGLVYVGIAAFVWGAFEAYGSTTRNLTAAQIRDASVPAVEAASGGEKGAVVLATNFITADIVPSVGVGRPLWNAHTSSAGGVGVEENKRLFYMFLYFSGYAAKDLEESLKANSFEVTAAIFGSERALPSLAGGSQKIGADEFRAESEKFAEFARSIGPRDAYSPVINSLIVPAEAEPDMSNVDRWYSRGEGRNFGLFRLYRLTPKPAVP